MKNNNFGKAPNKAPKLEKAVEAVEAQDSAAAATAALLALSKEDLVAQLQELNSKHAQYQMYAHTMADQFLVLKELYLATPALVNRPSKFNLIYMIKNWREIASFVLKVLEVLAGLFQKLDIKRNEDAQAPTA